MQRFTQLFVELDASTRTGDKLEALERYFREAPPQDAAWALVFLSGGKLARAVPTADLRAWAAEEAGLPPWLVDESEEAVGDLAEALALLVPEHGESRVQPPPLARLVEDELLPLRERERDEQRAAVTAAWRGLDRAGRLVWNKLLTGSLRVGVARTLVVRALAAVAGVPAELMAQRVSGPFEPSAESLQALLAPEGDASAPPDEVERPYPFFLAHALSGDSARLGEPHEWQFEWKWDGIRAQLVRRGGRSLLWSRGEEEVSARFPELAAAGERLPEGTVLDGEIVAWRGGPLPFQALQKRIGRLRPDARLLREVPVALMAYDLLEEAGADVRARPLQERRARLEALLATAQHPLLQLSPLVEVPSWSHLEVQRSRARAGGVEGLMLKRRDAPYGVGRPRGPWWKHKADPFSIDAVLLHARRGHGRRAGLYTDYTFGVWHEGELVPCAKAYSGLDDEEIHAVDAEIRRTTIAQHGPMRVVEPRLVFELHFEGLQASPRHRSGLALRFPRMARWRKDKRPEDADTLETLQALLQATASR